MRKSLLIAAAAGVAIGVPAIAIAGSSAGSAIDQAVSATPSKLLPMKINTPTATLTTGGSVINVKVPVVATGSQGFSNPIQVDVCLGSLGCKEANVSVKGNGPKVGNFKFTLFDIIAGPGVKASLQVTAQTTGFRSVLKNFVVPVN